MNFDFVRLNWRGLQGATHVPMPLSTKRGRLNADLRWRWKTMDYSLQLQYYYDYGEILLVVSIDVSIEDSPTSEEFCFRFQPWTPNCSIHWLIQSKPKHHHLCDNYSIGTALNLNHCQEVHKQINDKDGCKRHYCTIHWSFDYVRPRSQSILIEFDNGYVPCGSQCCLNYSYKIWAISLISLQ